MGFAVGGTPPGLLELAGVETPDRFRRQGEYPLDPGADIDIETPEDKAYWMGVASGFMVTGAGISGGLYIASAGHSGSLLAWTAMIATEAAVGLAPSVAVGVSRTIGLARLAAPVVAPLVLMDYTTSVISDPVFTQPGGPVVASNPGIPMALWISLFG